MLQTENILNLHLRTKLLWTIPKPEKYGKIVNGSFSESDDVITSKLSFKPQSFIALA